MVRMVDILRSSKKEEGDKIRPEKEKPRIVIKKVIAEPVPETPEVTEIVKETVEPVVIVEEIKKEIQPPKEEAVREESEEHLEEIISSDLYEEARKLMADYSKSASTGNKIEIARAKLLIAKIVDNLGERNDLFILANTPVPSPADFIYFNAVNVCILSIRVGMGLNYDRDRLIDLGLCALLHDIGLFKLPVTNIINKKGDISDDEFEIIKKHPQYGYEIMKQAEPEFRWIGDIIIQEHEREQGQGYPRGLAKNEIHEYARIIGLVDVYEALIHPRPHKKPHLPYEAIREIIRSRNEEFSPELIKVLINEISVFPVNTYVKLNTNEVAKVVDINRERPLRPKVAVIYDAKGNTTKEQKIIDLMEKPFIYITGPVAG